MVTFCALVIATTACSVRPETAPLVLEPQAESPVWPLPPAKARYAYVGTLIGEQNFLAGKAKTNKAKSIFAMIVGLVFGEPDYLELKRPMAGMVDDLGRILVLDVSLQAVIVFDLPRQKVLKWSRVAKHKNFAMPIAITGDGAGGFWVTDSELGEVIRLDGDGKPIARIGKGFLLRPTGITRNSIDGRIYVADTKANNIKVLDANGDLINTIGRRGKGIGEFNTPTHLAFSGSRLFVSDTLNFRVQAFNTDNDPNLVFGSIGINVGNMSRPKGIAVGEGGRIYVVESYFDHLLIFDNKGRFLMPIGGTGKEVGQFYLPGGVWTDKSGRVYVADLFNGRVSVFKELTTGDVE